MTHYAWDEAYHNNKNDALSTADSRPINNSIYNYDEVQSGAAYDDEFEVTEEEYAADGETLSSFNQNYTPYTTTPATTNAADNAPNIASVGGESWRNNYGVMEGSGYGNSSISGSLYGGSSMPIEGTYSRRGNRFGCRLPLAPVNDNSKYRMLPQPIAYTHNVLNEHTFYADERIGSFISLPAGAPMRMLPEPHPRVRNSTSQRLFEDNNSLGGVSTTTLTTTVTTGTSQNNDVFCQMSRPYTSMLPLDYGDYSDNAYNSDNLSAYSDTPPMSNATQLKLQQQRKISLMLAMTTASVIASGETRIPVQQQQQQYNTTKHNDNNSYTTCNRNIIDIVSSADSTTNSVAFTNTTTLASARCLNTTTSLTSTMTSTRKLPKRLPSPAVSYKSSPSILAEDPICNPLETVIQTPTHRTKQLPKLPMPKTKTIPSSVPIPDSAIVVSSLPQRLTSMLTNTPVKSMAYIEDANNFAQQEQQKEYLEQEQEEQEKAQVDQTAINKNNDINLFNDQRYQNDDLKPFDSFRTWSHASSTLHDTPALHQSDSTSLVGSNINTAFQVKPSIEPSFDPSLSTTNHQNMIFTTTATTSLVEVKRSSFDIYDYLKPYKFDSFKFTTENKNESENENENENENEIKKTNDSEAKIPSSTMNAYDARKNSLESFQLSSLETQMPYINSNLNSNLNSNSIANWTPSSSINIETPLCESSSNVSYLLSKPISIVDQGKEDAEHSDLRLAHDTATTPSHLRDVFTTTVIPSRISEIGISSTSSVCNLVNSPTLSYVDYMKKFDLPELPDLSPIPDICIVTTSQSQPVLTDTMTPSLVALTAENQGTVSTTVESHPLEFCIDSHKINENPIESSMWLPSLSSHSIKTSIGDINLLNSELSSTVDTFSSQQHESQKEKIDEKETREPLISEEFISSHIEEPLVSNVSVFDDSFYDSFNVDLSALTATIAHIESDTSLTPALKQNNNGDLINLATSNTCMGEISNTSEACSGYYKLEQKQIDEPQQSRPRAKVSSVLGGLSKGIKGGLDGVMNGVSSTMETTKQNPISNSKKGFGFGLASKFVPNVGSLLVRQDPMTTSTSAVSDIMAVESTPKTTPYGFDYVLDYDQLPDNINKNTSTDVSAPITPTMDYLSSKSNLDFDYLGNDALSYNDYSYSEYPVTYAHNVLCSSDPYKVTKSHELDVGSNETGVEIESPIKPQVVKSSVTSVKQNTKNASSGMFGSIFGKAAAAVQSATLAVNQGASSVASAVAQKATAQHISAASVVDQNRVIDVPVTTVSSSNQIPIINMSYLSNIEQTVIDNDNYNEQHPSHDSTYSTADDDYENSNTHMPNHDDNKAYSIYYSSDLTQSQNQSLSDDLLGKAKVLPTVPSAGSSGKKLPTINGKSGLMLIKQQPTEIFDDDEEVNESDDDLIDNLIGHTNNPSYCIDSEQNDYYMDHQPTTPSNRISNDYYEHVGSGYDYREDFFNEEDEYKYIEQQNNQQQQQQQQQEQQQQKHEQEQHIHPYQNSHKMLLSHKQSSLDYEDKGHNDDYLNETYLSDEDCGNYLDESSSGSVGITENRKQHLSGINTASVSASMEHLEHQHKQIKKQDSTIIEEDESSPINLKGDLSLSTHRSLEGELADDDHDHISVDDDQLADLLPTRNKSQKKKKVLVRGETEEVVSGHMQIIRKPEITAKQRWHWAYNKIIIQLNVST